MSESLKTVAELIYSQQAVDFDQQRFGVTYGRTEDGYFIINTGNTARDVVASVLLNEIGIDNFSNAITAIRGREYGEAVKQSLYGIFQAGLVVVPGVNVLRGAHVAMRAAGIAHGSLGRAIGSRLLQVPRNARYALNRFGEQPTIRAAIGSIVPRFGSTARQLRYGREIGIAPDAAGVFRSIGARRGGPVGVGGSTPEQLRAAEAVRIDRGTGVGRVVTEGPTQLQFPSGASGFPGPAASAPPVPPRRTQSMRAARARVREQMAANAAQPGGPTKPMWRQRANYFFGRAPIAGGPIEKTGFAAAPAGRAMARGGQAAIIGTGARVEYDRRGNIAEVAAQTLARENAAAVSSEAAAADIVRQGAVDERINAAINEIRPGGTGDQVSADLERDFSSAVGALNFQYDRAVGELRSMYRLSETDDERERIRFILADIQAQHEAGQRAITNVFERKRAEVAQLTERSRENAIKSAQQAFDLYTVSAGQLKDMLEANRQNTAQEIYGFGAAQARDQSEYVQLLSAMAPVAQQSRQAIGDIGTEGLEWLGAVMGEQTAARSADLQRLSLSTRAAAISQHQQQVDARVNAERMALAQAVQSLRERQASESGALQRAMLGQQGAELFGPHQMQEYLTRIVLQSGSIENAIEEYQINFAGKPNPLGGVYPARPPQRILNAIREAAVEFQAAKTFAEQTNLLQEAELAEAWERQFPGVPRGN